MSTRRTFSSPLGKGTPTQAKRRSSTEETSFPKRQRIQTPTHTNETTPVRVTPRTAAEYGLDPATQSILSKRPINIPSLASLIWRVVEWIGADRRIESATDIGAILREYASEVIPLRYSC